MQAGDRPHVPGAAAVRGHDRVRERCSWPRSRAAGCAARASYAAAAEALERTGMSGQANVAAERLGLLQRKRLELARPWPRSPRCSCSTRWRAASPTPRSPSWSRSSAGQRRGHRGDLDRARGARAHRRGEPADLPVPAVSSSATATRPRCWPTPAVREVFLGTEVTAALAGGSPGGGSRRQRTGIGRGRGTERAVTVSGKRRAGRTAVRRCWRSAIWWCTTASSGRCPGSR